MKKMKATAPASVHISVGKVAPSAGPEKAMAPSDEKPDMPDKWEIEDGVRTLERAEEVKKDKRLMPHVAKHIGKKLKSLKELKQMAGQKKLEEDADGDYDS